MATTELLDCGHPPTEGIAFGTGYGRDKHGARHCYDCCARNDREAMKADGAIVLYLTNGADGLHSVTNWPGTLRFRVLSMREYKRGGGFGTSRTDAWFEGPDGFLWHAVQRGESSQLARCKRTRQSLRSEAR